MSLGTPPDWAFDAYMAARLGKTLKEFEEDSDAESYFRQRAYFEEELFVSNKLNKPPKGRK